MISAAADKAPDTRTENECAALVVDTIPLIMRSIRAAIRSSGEDVVSMPQFRTLRYLQHNGPVSLSTLTSHLGGTAPGISKMIDHLVDRNYVYRTTDGQDRRRIALSLTPEGDSALQHLRALAVKAIADQFTTLNETETSVVTLAMKVIQSAIHESYPIED